MGIITLAGVVGVLAIIYWIIAVVYNKKQLMQSGLLKKLPANILILIMGGVLLFISLFVVAIPAQTVGVIITPAGVKQESLATGWHLVYPWYSVKHMDKTAQVYTCASATAYDGSKNKESNNIQSSTVWAPTSDGIKMGFDISASWAIDPAYAWWIYDNVSENDGGISGRYLWLEENVIKPKLKSALALVVSKFDPVSVYSTQRQTIQDEVFEKMKLDIHSYHLTLHQIDIREVYYNEDYEKAINAKKLEEQRTLALIEITKQKRELEVQAEIEKNIAIEKARGEAEALKIKGQSIAANPKIVQLEWIQKWDGKLPTYMLSDKAGLMLNMQQ